MLPSAKRIAFIYAMVLKHLVHKCFLFFWQPFYPSKSNTTTPANFSYEKEAILLCRSTSQNLKRGGGGSMAKRGVSNRGGRTKTTTKVSL